ncbi:hypothetical protein HYC85_021268 [Camellia sinensis]|uniref:YABBY protein C-terminal domain-containing protein n=1 Tax=Camellia sinensis TaxID=4442 RepID=A0A7J7GJM4_CAMSI|nr:hypothetical protein HYC85_021268 [Camellia sinensis]
MSTVTKLLSLSLSLQPKEEIIPQEAETQKVLDKRSPSLVISSDDDEEEEDAVLVNHVVNKPPEKRQRAPSAYNNFIKEEIRRLKAKYPNMTHKEAFSAAAKNVHVEGNGFRERKASRHSIWTKTPFE